MLNTPYPARRNIRCRKLRGVRIRQPSEKFRPWKLPGDVFYHRGDFTVYFPLGTCLLFSVILTIFFGLFRK
ncbi:MAG: DUF2905 domain-containing protein [Deltaproteobacteria bacterium]|nr:DUF2905 domain-containing protein [Deltaproteobacteria bacterium]